MRSRLSHQGKPSNQILTAKHIIVAKIPRDGGERTAQPLKSLHLVGRAEQRPDAAIFVVKDPAEVIDVAEFEEERQQPSRFGSPLVGWNTGLT